jgi:hypothetical protein
MKISLVLSLIFIPFLFDVYIHLGHGYNVGWVEHHPWRVGFSYAQPNLQFP